MDWIDHDLIPLKTTQRTFGNGGALHMVTQQYSRGKRIHTTTPKHPHLDHHIVPARVIPLDLRHAHTCCCAGHADIALFWSSAQQRVPHLPPREENGGPVDGRMKTTVDTDRGGTVDRNVTKPWKAYICMIQPRARVKKKK